MGDDGPMKRTGPAVTAADGDRSIEAPPAVGDDRASAVQAALGALLATGLHREPAIRFLEADFDLPDITEAVLRMADAVGTPEAMAAAIADLSELASRWDVERSDLKGMLPALEWRGIPVLALIMASRNDSRSIGLAALLSGDPSFIRLVERNGGGRKDRLPLLHPQGRQIPHHYASIGSEGLTMTVGKDGLFPSPKSIEIGNWILALADPQGLVKDLGGGF
jgi:hypothetical protein